MGNLESKGQDFIDQFTQNYRYEKDMNDSRLGYVKIYNRIFDDKDYVAVKVYPRQQKVNQLNTFAAFMNYNGNLIGTSQNDHPNLIKLYAFKANLDQELTLYYEYCYTNIEQQIDMRISHNMFFSAEELWRTMLSVIMAGNFLEAQSRHIGDVNTKRMYINKKGVVKVAPYMQAQSDIDSFKRAGFFNEYGFLSPECLEKFRERDILAQINYMKNDVYGLGISILEMATLKRSSELYDWNSYQLKQNLIEDRLEEARQRYGEYLLHFMRKLLHTDINQRSSFSSLFQELLPYQQQIITGVGFQDITIFKVPINGISGFDSIIRKLDTNLHSKQESQTSTQLHPIITKVSNQPSLYQSSEQNKSLCFTQPFNYGLPATVQINMSPTKDTSFSLSNPTTQQKQFLQQQQPLSQQKIQIQQQQQTVIQQQPVQQQPQQFITQWKAEREQYKFKTEESETSIINKGVNNNFDLDINSKYPQYNKLQHGGINNNNLSLTNQNNYSTNTIQLLNSDGFNTTRDNTMMYRVSNGNRPLNPDQRSVSPSPVLHLQVTNQLRVAPKHQHTPIQINPQKQCLKNYGNYTCRVDQNQIPLNSQTHLNEFKKTPIPIKKITLNNILNQNVSAQCITTQKTIENRSFFTNSSKTQAIQNNFSQENFFTGNISSNQKSFTAARPKEPVVQINLPVHRTNRNMILSPIPHNNRSVSPSHVLIQRSITPNVRNQFTNQMVLVTPHSNRKSIPAIYQTINNNNTVENDNMNKHNYQLQHLEKHINPSLPENTVSPRFSFQSNQVYSINNENQKGYCNTDRHTQNTFKDENKLHQFISNNQDYTRIHQFQNQLNQ